MTAFAFVLVDVFTAQPLRGNQLAVFPDADRLDAAQMQAAAREFNYSETTFVVAPRDPRATRRLRSFSPAAEVFGAGHNALGAWWAVIAGGHVALAGSGTVWQELGSHVLPLEVTLAGGTLERIAMTQATPHRSDGAPAAADLAAALSLDERDLRESELTVRVVSTGPTTHMLVPVRDLSALARVRVDGERLISVARPFGCEGCYVFCLETIERESVAHARGFFPGIAIAEDPATGSAAGPLGVYLVDHGRARRDTWLTIEQGDEMQRPSRIEVRVRGESVDVGGRCAIVAEDAMQL